ncbi:hypothetical protein IFM51744_04735 [Aspergillus udagawae]|nr:hypothetical protein IFM51744_04735 [Aspergillus udagawae]
MTLGKYERLRQLESLNDQNIPFLTEDVDATKIELGRARYKRLRKVLVAQWVAILFLCSVILVGTLPIWKINKYYIPDEIYSPAQHIVRYHNIAFNPANPKSKSKYMGPPTDENNKAWRDLYDAGMSAIPMEDAAKLVNSTAPIPGAPGYYDMLRTTVWGVPMQEHHAHGPQDDVTLGPLHLDHCIDALRQSIMCSSDISPIVYSWNEAAQRVKGNSGTVHTCRDFEAIRQWAIEHQAPEIDYSVHVPDPLKGEMV